MFDLGESGGLLIDQYWDDAPSDSRVDDTANLSTLAGGQQFVYVFDLGDNWAPLCTVGPERIDPLDSLGITPDGPLPYWDGAASPTSTAADGTATTARPRRRQTPDLPALQPGWGPRHR